jgi:transcriptional regulator with XRE-family HTH domain
MSATTAPAAPTADELRRWREGRGISQSDLARRLGVDRVTVARWETGARQPPPFLRLALDALSAETATSPTS